MTALQVLQVLRVYFTALSPCERAPPGLGLSCPQPDPDHPARWVRFLAPRPWDVRLMTALQVLQVPVQVLQV